MEFPLVVGVDGSDSSLQAVDRAVDEAVRHGLPLRLVHASLWERYEGALPSFSVGRPAEAVTADHIIASCVERAGLRNPEVKVSGEVLPDDAVPVLLRAGPEAFSLVTRCRGRGGFAGLLLGSVSLAVAARAVCPDALVEAHREHPDVGIDRQLVEGPAHKVLLGSSAEADLIVIGALRRHGHFGLQLGRAAHALLHHSPCPIAVIPQRV
jgi:nucleotide-binding universal stress UspA family protein